MKPINFTLILITFFLYFIMPQKAWADNKTKTFNITILNTAGTPQKNIFLKISGYSSEYPIDEQGNINFKHEINPSYIRTANLYFLRMTKRNRSNRSSSMNMQPIPFSELTVRMILYCLNRKDVW